MNLQAILTKSLFKRARGNGQLPFSNNIKLGTAGCQPLDFAEIFDLIGRDPNHAIRHERPMQRGKEVLRYNSTRGMPPLWPWIRKHQMKHSHRTRREEVTDCVGNLPTQNASIADVAVFDFPTGTSHPSSHPLNAKKISLWTLSGRGDQKRAIAASKVDLQRCLALENGAEIKWREIIRGNELRSVCYYGHAE